MEDAKKKWCPKAVHVIHSAGYASGNRVGSDSAEQDKQCLCLGSGCMMWESWEYEKLGGGTIGKEPKITMHKGEGDCGLKTKEACHEI